MDAIARRRPLVWLLLPVVAALFFVTSPATTPADSALLLERAAALQQARPPGTGEITWPSSTVWVSYPLALVQWIAGKVSGAPSPRVYLDRTETVWRDLLRVLWALLAAAVVLRFVFAWCREAPGPVRFLLGAVLLLAPLLAVGMARLLPAVPAALVLGELFSRLLASEPLRRRDEWTIGVALGMLLAWFPFDWVALPIVVLLLLRWRRPVETYGRVLGSALVLAMVLEPMRMVQPGAALLRAATEWQRAGGWSGPGGGGFLGFLAVSAMLGPTAWLLWGGAAGGGLNGARRRDAALAAVGLWVLGVLVPVLTGVRRPGDLQWSVVPWLIAWGAAGSAALPPLRSRPTLGWAVAALLLLAGAAPARVNWQREAERGARVKTEMRAEIPGLVSGGELCVGEVAWPGAESDSLARRWLFLPKDSRAPARYDYVYWSRWYAGFRWVLLSGSRVSENLSRRDARTERRFYSAVARDGVLEREWGRGEGGFRLYRIRDGSEWRRPIREAELGAFAGRKEMSWFLSQLGDRYLTAGAPRATEAISRVGLEWDKESTALYGNLGIACLRLEDPAEAAKAFEAGLRLSPGSFELLWNLSLACVQARLYPRAESLLRRVVDQRPDFAAAHYELARVFLAQDKGGLARRAFEEYLRLAPSSPQRATIEEILCRLPVEVKS